MESEKAASNGRNLRPIDLEIGKAVRKARAAKGWTQGELAARVGLSFQQIQKYEVGSNRISVSVLFDICEALEITVTDFLGGLVVPTKPAGDSAEG